MLYHITYRARDGRTEVGRIGAANRNEAIREAAMRFGVRQGAIQSAVACPPRAVTTDCTRCGRAIYSDGSGHSLSCRARVLPKLPPVKVPEPAPLGPPPAPSVLAEAIWKDTQARWARERVILDRLNGDEPF